MIPGYRAIIDPAAAGLGFEALVQVTMDRQDASMIAGFERGLAAIPEIRHPERLLSGPDHLVRAATARPGLLPGPARRETRHLPGVQRLTSTIVMKRILDDRPYPPRGPGRHPPQGLATQITQISAACRRSIWAGRHGRPERRLRTRSLRPRASLSVMPGQGALAIAARVHRKQGRLWTAFPGRTECHARVTSVVVDVPPAAIAGRKSRSLARCRL